MNKKRFDITTIEDLNKFLLKENKNIEDYSIYKEILLNNKITFRVRSVSDFEEYMMNMALFKKLNKILFNNIKRIDKLIIKRVEYERIQTIQDNVKRELLIIEELRKRIAEKIEKDKLEKIHNLEDDIEKKYLFSKDVELLKKIVINENNIEEYFDEENCVKTLIISIPKEININYINVKKGSLEYHDHLKNNIPRLRRLINNLEKYLIKVTNETNVYELNQSEVLQDSINIAVASYNENEYKAISGSNNIDGYCETIKYGESKFKSYKVNKLGKLGTGYNRHNDSEKKILEYIHNDIESGKVSSNGKLVLYTKWEPCPSCYYVIHQFLKQYPKVDVKVKYNYTYGEMQY